MKLKDYLLKRFMLRDEHIFNDIPTDQVRQYIKDYEELFPDTVEILEIKSE
jgi:hypothetical protein